MVKLFYTKPAVQDLRNIHDYIAADSQKAAKRFISALKEKIKILKVHPEFGRPVLEDKYQNLRQVLYKSYRIIYQLKDDIVFVITIHHQSRLPENIPSLQNL